jgi:hypothetical protein
MSRDATETAGTQSATGLCVLVEYCEWSDERWNFWTRVSMDLERRGQTLLILSPHPAPERVRSPLVLPIPSPTTGEAHEESLFRQQGSADLVRRTVLDELVPDTLLVSMPAQCLPGRSLLNEARRREIPAFCVTHGLLPGALTFESHGTTLGADVRFCPAVASALTAHRADARLVSSLRTSVARRSHRPGGTDAPLILVVGADPDASADARRWPASLADANRSTAFAGAYERVRLAAPKHAVIVACPDPTDVEGRRFCSDPSNRVVTADGAMRDLIARADVVVAIAETPAQYQALLDQKPLIALARTSLTDTGAVYSAHGFDLQVVLLSALRPGAGWSTRAEAADRVLSFLASHCLYSDRRMSLPQGVGDVAAFIARLSCAAADADARIARFVDRMAPVVASTVCDQLDRGVMAMTQALEPYVEAAVVSEIRLSGVTAAAVCGGGAVARRLVKAMAQAGIRTPLIIDPDAAADRAPGLDAARFPASAIVIASHTDASRLRGWLKRAGLPGAVRIFDLERRRHQRSLGHAA